MTIFTTGAYLCPMKVDKTWVWVVSGFEDDSFMDGKVCNPNTSAESIEKLLKEE